MNYSLLIKQHKRDYLSVCSSALQFARALCEQGHTLTTLFFYQDAVQVAQHRQPFYSDIDIQQQFQEFAQKHHIPFLFYLTTYKKATHGANLPVKS